MNFKQVFVLCLALCSVQSVSAQKRDKATYHLLTDDITRFWLAYDSLKYVHTSADSVHVIQHSYLDKMSVEGRKFVHVDKNTVTEYICNLKDHPRYFKALRVKTDKIKDYKPLIDSNVKKLQAALPGYEMPDVCFFIGRFKGGCDADKHVIHMAAEVMLADSLTDFSEFSGNQLLMLKDINDPITKIAELSIHQLQGGSPFVRSLLNLSMYAGVSTFLTELILNVDLISKITPYAIKNECSIWQEFTPKMSYSDDLPKFIFNLGVDPSKPANLGYFVGKRISEAYYNTQTDKKKAISNLLKKGNYNEILRTNGYNGNCNLVQAN